MSEAGWLQIGGFIVTVITLWLTMHYKLKGVETKAEEIKSKVGAVHEKAAHIETLTNSNLAAVKSELSVVKAELVTSNGQIKSMQELMKALTDRNGRVDSATRTVKVEETKPKE